MHKKKIRIAGRSLRRISRAFLARRNYVALANMFRLARNPIDFFARYLFRVGNYPFSIAVKTPAGLCQINLHHPDDVLTVNEIFFRKEYPIMENDMLVVDFGSNIGISALYFLTNARQSFVYLFEPLPTNIGKLKKNLLDFESRYELAEVAVGPYDGEVRFGFEETGRLGGISNQAENYIIVKCRRAEVIISDILDRHPHIDVLKIDIEGLEGEIVCRIPPQLLTRINRIYLEWNADVELLRRVREHLSDSHEYRDCGSVAHFTKPQSMSVHPGTG